MSKVRVPHKLKKQLTAQGDYMYELEFKEMKLRIHARLKELLLGAQRHDDDT